RLVGIFGSKENLPNEPNGVFQPPPKPRCYELLVKQAADKLHVTCIPARLSIITRPLNGRAACHYCGQCNRGCKVNANFTSTNVLIAPALATGKLTLVTNAMAREVTVDGTGRATGVPYVDKTTGADRHVRANVVVLAASAPGYGFMGGIQRYAPGGGYGKQLKDDYRHYYGATIGFSGRGEMIPNDDSYCELDPRTVDRWGIPVLRFHWKWADHEVKQVKHMQETFRALIAEMGGKVFSPMPTPEQGYGIAAGGTIIHELGGARMGDDPKTSVTNRWCQAHEWDTVRILVDLILPKDERSGSATEAGVPEFMDFMLGDDTDLQTPVRGGLAWLDHECDDRYGKTFVACADAERTAVLDDIAWPKKAKPEHSAVVAVFNSVRYFTASGFFSSRVGTQDLRYIGNTFVAEWKGCPPEALAKLGV